MAEYFLMGGYGGYVWAAYGVSALVLLVLWLRARRLFSRAAVQGKNRPE